MSFKAKNYLTAVIGLALTGCNLQSLPPPVPQSSYDAGKRGGGQDDGTRRGEFGDLDQTTYLTGQKLVGNWDGSSDEVAPDSRWIIETRGGGGWQTANEISISLMHPVDLKNESYQFLLSAPNTTKSLELCEGDCSAQGVKLHPAQYVFFKGSRKFFWMSAAALVEDALILDFRTLDGAGQQLSKRGIEFVLKGSTRKRGSPTPSATPNPLPSGSALPTQISLIEAQSLLRQYCAGAGCHDNYASNPNAMNKSTALARVQSDMPRGRSMIGPDRERLIAWLKQ
jgi:hypothetical protein